MTPKDSSDLTAAKLMALRTQPDALKIITELLKVKEMGPADHIRTKHEVKAFIETAGNAKEAEAIIQRAQLRRTLEQAQDVRISQRQDRRMHQ